MSVEQEPLLARNVPLAASGPSLIATLQIPGTAINRPLSALPPFVTNPFRLCRIRGVAWVSGSSATQLELLCFQGTALTGGVQILDTMIMPSAGGGNGVPLAFDFIDANPNSLQYVLVGYSGSAIATSVTCVATITGYPS